MIWDNGLGWKSIFCFWNVEENDLDHFSTSPTIYEGGSENCEVLLSKWTYQPMMKPPRAATHFAIRSNHLFHTSTNTTSSTVSMTLTNSCTAISALSNCVPWSSFPDRTCGTHWAQSLRTPSYLCWMKSTAEDPMPRTPCISLEVILASSLISFFTASKCLE